MNEIENQIESRRLYQGDQNMNPKGISLLELIWEDFRTHDSRLCGWGFWALLLHRIGNWRMGIKPRLLRAPFSLIYRCTFPFTELLLGIKIDYNVPVGRRVRIDHCGGMVLGARSIGNDCIIRQNTTFGIVRPDRKNGKPTIEDRVDIGTGVVILGDIIVGHDSIIGANAVVTKNVAPYSVMGGVPAKLIHKRKDETIMHS